MTDCNMLTNERIKEAFEAANLPVPTDEEIKRSDGGCAILATIITHAYQVPTSRWVEDMLVPHGVMLGELIEPDDFAPSTEPVYRRHGERPNPGTEDFNMVMEGIVPS